MLSETLLRAQAAEQPRPEVRGEDQTDQVVEPPPPAPVDEDDLEQFEVIEAIPEGMICLSVVLPVSLLFNCIRVVIHGSEFIEAKTH